MLGTWSPRLVSKGLKIVASLAGVYMSSIISLRTHNTTRETIMSADLIEESIGVTKWVSNAEQPDKLCHP
jgi:hypothetical protein